MKAETYFKKTGSIYGVSEKFEFGEWKGYAKKFDSLEEAEDVPIQTIALDVEFAWAIRSDELLKVCQKYHVDMRIYAFERGMEFNLEIEIINGKITKDSYFAFQDYNWECICPHMGG